MHKLTLLIPSTKGIGVVSAIPFKEAVKAEAQAQGVDISIMYEFVNAELSTYEHVSAK